MLETMQPNESARISFGSVFPRQIVEITEVLVNKTGKHMGEIGKQQSLNGAQAPTTNGCDRFFIQPKVEAGRKLACKYGVSKREHLI